MTVDQSESSVCVVDTLFWNQVFRLLFIRRLQRRVAGDSSLSNVSQKITFYHILTPFINRYFINHFFLLTPPAPSILNNFFSLHFLIVDIIKIYSLLLNINYVKFEQFEFTRNKYKWVRFT